LPVIMTLLPWARASCSKTLFSDLIAENCPGEGQSSATFAPGECVQMIANLSALRYGSGFNNSPLTMLKIAVFAPTPRPSVMTATSVKPGFFHNSRAPKRRSCHKVCMVPPLRIIHEVTSRITKVIPSLHKPLCGFALENLFASESDHRINFRRPSSRDVTGQQRNQSQQQSNARERHRVCRAHLEQQFLHQSRSAERRRHSQ